MQSQLTMVLVQKPRNRHCRFISNHSKSLFQVFHEMDQAETNEISIDELEVQSWVTCVMMCQLSLRHEAVLQM